MDCGHLQYTHRGTLRRRTCVHRVQLGRATRGMVDLAAFDPESVAQQYLHNALASPEVAGFTAPEVNGQESEFKSLGVETVLLIDTKTVKFR